MDDQTRNIVVRGAREHNLKSIDVNLPRERLVVITGPSGSGKSSLAFDTIYAEGQRRYVESLSSQTRRFLERIPKPEVDVIEGLSPAISVEQSRSAPSPRSTVGTLTEVHDYLRVLFARAGTPHCPSCSHPLIAHTVQAMVDRMLAEPEGTRLQVLAPLEPLASPDLELKLIELRKRGFVRVRIDGRPHDLGEINARIGHGQHRVDVVVDRVVVKGGARARLTDSVELAVSFGRGVVGFLRDDGGLEVLCERLHCVACDRPFPALEPGLFSFNSPHGACPQCGGVGRAGAAGDGDGSATQVSGDACGSCLGTRLRHEARCVRIGEHDVASLSRLSMADAHQVLAGIAGLGARGEAVAERVVREVCARLRCVMDLGLPYLSLDREATSLSGGELQRIRLATQVGAGLVGVLYVLDEPSIGLHPRDTVRLIESLKSLRDRGSSLLVVEHDLEMIRAADHVLELGPGAGRGGGRVVAQGPPDELVRIGTSMTGQYLSGARTVPVPGRRRVARATMALRHVSLHNLKDVSVTLPVGVLTCVTGVSGSGKSSLVFDALLPRLAALHSGREVGESGLARVLLEGGEHVDQVIAVDQSAVGRTPRSSPASYTGLLDPLRDLFAGLPEARARGYRKARFSTNLKGGRCEACEGDGQVRIAMSFLPDVYAPCEQCGGARYNRETLEVHYRGLSIADVLALTVEEAREVFHAVPKIRTRLDALGRVGLGYLALGQSAATLSGGEAQRVRLAAELARRSTARTLYVLDEPTTGLNLRDVEVLLEALDALVDAGSTVVVVEHNMDVIKCADHVIDLGPEGGPDGGRVVVEGTPEAVAACSDSHTGRFLSKLLG